MNEHYQPPKKPGSEIALPQEGEPIVEPEVLEGEVLSLESAVLRMMHEANIRVAEQEANRRQEPELSSLLELIAKASRVDPENVEAIAPEADEYGRRIVDLEDEDAVPDLSAEELRTLYEVEAYKRQAHLTDDDRDMLFGALRARSVLDDFEKIYNANRTDNLLTPAQALSAGLREGLLAAELIAHGILNNVKEFSKEDILHILQLDYLSSEAASDFVGKAFNKVQKLDKEFVISLLARSNEEDNEFSLVLPDNWIEKLPEDQLDGELAKTLLMYGHYAMVFPHIEKFTGFSTSNALKFVIDLYPDDLLKILEEIPENIVIDSEYIVQAILRDVMGAGNLEEDHHNYTKLTRDLVTELAEAGKVEELEVLWKQHAISMSKEDLDKLIKPQEAL